MSDTIRYPIEPWQPVEGQRVRVHVSYECQVEQCWLACPGDDDCRLGEHETRLTGHDPAEDGATGTILTIDPPDEDAPDPMWDAHRVLVDFDEPIVGAPTPYPQTCMYYAIFELQPEGGAP